MGKIIGITQGENEEEVIIKVKLDYKESLQLRGNIKNIHLFSEDASKTKANLSQRGKNGATKYFLIPKDLRKGMKYTETVRCQKIDVGNKTFFIYIVDKVSI
jgi:hypothetical protein